MSIAVISDVHANLEALETVLAHADGLGVDDVVCLGDVVGYNASPVECVDLLRARPGLVCLLGNHDAMAAGLDDLLGINRMAFDAMTWTRRQLDDERRAWLAGLPLVHASGDAVFVHASLDAPREWRYVRDAVTADRSLAVQEARVCFLGHSHIPGAWVAGDGLPRPVPGDVLETAPGERWLVNVGSVGQPRDGDSRAAYVTYDPESGRVTRHRVAYDVEAARARILATDLPPVLADRLR